MTRSRWILAILLALTLATSAGTPTVVTAAPGGERRPLCGFSTPPQGCYWDIKYVLEPCFWGDPFGTICVKQVCTLVCPDGGTDGGGGWGGF